MVRNTIGLRLATLGPLENADYVGLDLTLAIHDAVIPRSTPDPHPSPLLRATWSPTGNSERAAVTASWTGPQGPARTHRGPRWPQHITAQLDTALRRPESGTVTD